MGDMYERRGWTARELLLLIEAVERGYAGDGTGGGVCMICNCLMDDHPPLRVLVADPRLCPTEKENNDG